MILLVLLRGQTPALDTAKRYVSFVGSRSVRPKMGLSVDDR